jgi:hypothetical protein
MYLLYIIIFMDYMLSYIDLLVTLAAKSDSLASAYHGPVALHFERSQLRTLPVCLKISVDRSQHGD